MMLIKNMNITILNLLILQTMHSRKLRNMEKKINIHIQSMAMVKSTKSYRYLPTIQIQKQICAIKMMKLCCLFES